MRTLHSIILAGSAVLLVAACTTTPMGPMIPVMPGPNKSQEAFAGDDDACQQYAADRVQRHVEAAQNSEVANGAIGAAVGAGIGAAAAHTAATGAAIGGVAGALLGSSMGAGYHQAGVQRQYDMAYAGCMKSRGNEIAGGPPRPHRPGWYYRHGLGPPPPPPGSAPPPPPDDSAPPPPPSGS
ncbi:MAG TPA: hypothetical protein VGM17_06870 [Rhizomicrobium sp.]|jgi:hypothetical protein